MIHWNVEPDIFSVGFIHLRWYGLMFLIGFTIGYKVFQRICIIEKKPLASVDSLLTHVFFGTLIGARLGHCFFYEPIYFMQNPMEIFAIWNGGLASHGGGIGVFISLWIFSKKNKEFSLIWLLDRISVLVAFTGGFIRIGNLMNSEIIGMPSDVPWAFVFEKVDKLARHPTQIYESVSYFFIALIGFKIYKKMNSKPPDGLLFGITISSIFIFRFIWEFFKENQEKFESQMPINMGQILSIPFIFVGIYLVKKALNSKKSLEIST